MAINDRPAIVPGVGTGDARDVKFNRQNATTTETTSN